MPVLLRLDPRDPTPLWAQIEAAVRRLVASGTLAGGDALPSVRELAQELTVNPATVSKAYQRLADAGVLEVRRGEGTFVAPNPPTGRRRELERALKDGAAHFAALAVTLGVPEEEAVRELRAAWSTLARGRGEKR